MTVGVVALPVSTQLSQRFMHSFTETLKSSLSTAKSTVSIFFSYHHSEKPPKSILYAPLQSQVFNLIPHLWPA